jgi:hypothetical protein
MGTSDGTAERVAGACVEPGDGVAIVGRIVTTGVPPHAPSRRHVASVATRVRVAMCTSCHRFRTVPSSGVSATVGVHVGRIAAEESRVQVVLVQRARAGDVRGDL